MSYREKYRMYLESPAWSRKSKLVRDRAQGMCERCKWQECDDVHHLTYDHVFDERLHELQCVCRGCHEFLGGYSKVDPLEYSKTWFSYYQKKLAEIPFSR